MLIARRNLEEKTPGTRWRCIMIKKILDLIGGNIAVYASILALGVSIGTYIGWWAHGWIGEIICQSEKNTIVKLAINKIERLEKANDEIQTAYDGIRKYRESKRMPVQCLYPGGSGILATSGDGHAGGNGAITGTTEDFRDYGARCEEYRRERILLDARLNGVRSVND